MKFSLSDFYSFFAPQGDGFAECIIVISLAAMITLAFMNKLTPAFAGALTALNVGGIAHDNLTTWLTNKFPIGVANDDHK